MKVLLITSFFGYAIVRLMLAKTPAHVSQALFVAGVAFGLLLG